MNYTFTQPPSKIPTFRGIDRISAIMLFRDAVGCTLAYAIHNLEINLGRNDTYAVHDVGYLIRAYYAKQQGC